VRWGGAAVEEQGLLAHLHEMRARGVTLQGAGITLASVPLISPTRTGWAITPSDLSTRDLLSSQENIEIITRIFRAKTVKQPETWYNYAVPGVPSSFHSISGLGAATMISTAEIIEEEVVAQTTERPVSCRPSRYGPNPQTGKTTWIISFLTPVRLFRLFNASEPSKAIDKKTAISRYDLGCQGFCNPAKCTRYARYSIYSTRIDQYTGPSGLNCTEKVRCTNCHRPFPAGYDYCPAAPRRRNSRIIKPTKKELDALCRKGNRKYQEFNIPVPSPIYTLGQIYTNSQLQPQAPGPATANITKSKKRKGIAVTIYEEGSSQATSTTSLSPSPSLSAPTLSAPTSSSHSRQTTVTDRNLNIADLTSKSFGDNSMEFELDNEY
jgi:hypothetical protein